MQIHQKSNGKYVVANYMPTKGRFRSNLTADFTPVESSSLDNLQVREYSSIESIARALRKYKDKL